MTDRTKSLAPLFPERLVWLRKERGLTQRALADAAGLSQALIAELERGKHPPSRSSLAKIAAALGTDPSTLAPSE